METIRKIVIEVPVAYRLPNNICTNQNPSTIAEIDQNSEKSLGDLRDLKSPLTDHQLTLVLKINNNNYNNNNPIQTTELVRSARILRRVLET